MKDSVGNPILKFCTAILANYFAVNASYSNRYAYQTSNGCKVLTEEIFSCPPNKRASKAPNETNW